MESYRRLIEDQTCTCGRRLLDEYQKGWPNNSIICFGCELVQELCRCPALNSWGHGVSGAALLKAAAQERYVQEEYPELSTWLEIVAHEMAAEEAIGDEQAEADEGLIENQ
jgi:hypothetical protein